MDSYQWFNRMHHNLIYGYDIKNSGYYAPSHLEIRMTNMEKKTSRIGQFINS